MEREERGLRSRFRDWRHRRSRSHTPAAYQNERSPNPPASAEAALNKHARTSTAEPQGMGKSPEVIPVVTLTKPDNVEPEGPVVRSVEDERSALWKQAYDELREDNPSLVEEYEMVLKEQAGVPQDGNVQEQMHAISKAQQLKCENKQWSFQWFGHPQSVRDTVEQILNLTSHASSLISIGLNQAPPYVSVPWSAVTALIPLMMNDFKEHKGCVAGLEIVVRLTFSYQMAEQTFLGSADTRDLYRRSVIGLYKKILEYEALAMQYFGRSTLRRLGKNVVGSTTWANMPAELSKIDDDARRSLLFLGQLSLSELLTRQQKAIINLIQSAAAKKDEVTQVARWISAISVELDHQDVRAKLGSKHHCSGGWFLDDPRVRAWRNWDWNESGRCLWLRGGVGTGKSSLVSILIQDLIGSADGCVAFFYCSKKADNINQSSTARNDYENALRCLLSQVSISVDGSAVDKGVLKRFSLDTRGLLAGVGLSAEDCVQMLDDIFSAGHAAGHNEKFTLVVDALDECLDFDALMDALQRATSANKNVRLIFSSRFQVKVQHYFEGSVCVDVGGSNTDDIKKFLDIEIPRRRAGSGMTDSQAQRLADTLVAKASGMFMWVKLQLNLFLNEIRSKRIRLEGDIEPKLLSLESSEAIGEELLYATYEQVYEAAIGVQEDRRKEIVTTALRWVLCAFRTLTLRELAYATSVKPDGTVAENIQEGLVMEFCSNLLIEDAIGKIRLTHLSVRHYLEAREPPDFDAQLAHLQAALTCLYFANSPKYHEISHNSTDTFQHGNVVLTKSFHTYVQANWTRHCREAKKSTEIRELMDRFARRLTSRRKTSTLDESEASPNLYADFTAEDLGGKPASRSYISRSFVRLLRRHKDDAVKFVEQFIARGGDLGVRNEFGNTLLHEAVRFRVTEVISLLLHAGAPVNARDGLGNTPLHLTALHRFDHGAQLLLQARADKNARNSKGETPLHIAISLAVQDVIDTLLSANPDGVARDLFDDTPLHRAAAMGNSMVTESLLAMGFSPDSKNQSGCTPLSLAIKLHHLKVAKVLVEHGASATNDDLARSGLDEMGLLQRRQSRLDNNNVYPRPDQQGKGYTYAVEFPNGSHACDRCDISRWLTGSKRGTSHRHHSSIQQLFASAENGCPLCEVFCRQLPHAEDEWKAGCTSEHLTVSLESSHKQGSRQDRKDRLLLSAGNTQLLSLELCLSKSYHSNPPDNTSNYNDVMPELEWLCGRQVEELPLDFWSLRTVKNWIKTCQKEHHDCWRDGLSGVLPSRLLDVGTRGDNTVRLHDTSTHISAITAKGFVYFSHFWGTRRPAVEATSRTLQSLRAGMPLASLSKLHRDAITATRRLGFRYLWIDALCIIQDDPMDWDTENSRTKDYVSNAAFVLQAAALYSADLTLYQPRPQPLLRAVITKYRESEDIGFYHEGSISTSVALRRPLQTASEALRVQMMTRKWMFQEIILARKILIFGPDQIYWRCQAGLMSEGDTLIHEPMLKLLPVSSASTDFERRDSLHSWYHLLSDYSAGKSDTVTARFQAMESLARYFDTDGTLVAGLWKRDLRNGLLWRVEDIRTDDIAISRGLRDTRHDFYVSWSWVSTDDRVRYDLLQGARYDLAPAGQFSITDISIDRGGPNSRKYLPDNFEGPVSHIELEAMACEAHITRFEEGCVCFFDNIKWDLEWRDSKKFLFVLLCPWTPNPAGELKQACGLGLIVRRLEYQEENLFKRCGLFLGTAYDARLKGWTRQRLRIT